MKGLLLKDLLNLRRQGRSILLVLVFWLAIAVANGKAAVFGGLVMMYAAFLPLTAISLDERAGWEGYALTTPVSRTALVCSRYLLALLAGLAALVLNVGVSLAMSGGLAESLTVSLGFLCLGVAFAAVILPIIHKFGVEKGRLLMMLVLLVPLLGSVLLDRLGLAPGAEAPARLLALAPGAALALFGLSALLSIRIYKKKEF